MKRLLDVLLSALALAFLWPFILGIAIAVYVKLGSPIFFRQTRAGLHGQSFEMVKFRSMHNAIDGYAGRSDAERLTPFGEKLRATSLDELPELWNVLKGDMSIVGPRPLLMEYLPLYSPEQRRRHDVRPGITGWAQVNGRNAISWPEKFALDVWYVDNRALVLDLKIMFMTIKKVACREGITSENSVAAEKFGGN
ncbi:sugar transferase [Bradyrhizobium sp. CIR3A]|nr:sugar transferase [Bradyrhizobium sp. CIR3A]MBB4258760.1 lipopolysaccharide/colanic/teichoic acid biosynthesis glycosyltransferase [Bradyrhizobium sp. CIR3A]